MVIKVTRLPEHEKEKQGEQNYGPAPPLGFHIQVYIAKEIEDQEALINRLEPGAEHKQKKDFVCRAFHLTDPDPIAAAATQHPVQFATRPTVHPSYFLVADRPNFNIDGLAVVQLQWDGQTDGRSNPALRNVGKHAFRRFQRAPVTSYDTEAAVPRLCSIAQGYRKWAPTQLRFAIHTLTYPDADVKLSVAVDPDFARRRHGEDRLAQGAWLDADVVHDAEKVWPALAKEHVKLCAQERFVQNFVENFCIFGDTETPADGVLLVRMEREKSERSDGKKTFSLDFITCVRRPAAVAYQELVDVVEGKAEWEGVRPS